MVLFLPRVSAVVLLKSQKPYPSIRLFRSLSPLRRCQQHSSHHRPSFRPMSTFKYPATQREELVENLHGVDVPDPYRWLENPKSQETNVMFYQETSLTGRRLSRPRTLSLKIISLSFNTRTPIARCIPLDMMNYAEG
jgi:Prolyl oligopeptidase, N-terminal beta-propeller domain